MADPDTTARCGHETGSEYICDQGALRNPIQASRERNGMPLYIDGYFSDRTWRGDPRPTPNRAQ